MTDWLKNKPSHYASTPLEESSIGDCPHVLFDAWFSQARKTAFEAANVMHLATVDSNHKPNCRVVLLKHKDTEGLVFFTNLHSTKASELNCQPYACVNFFWPEQKRQVRVLGPTRPLPDADCDDYFASRPRESQLGAWASEQSSSIPSRTFLEQRFEALQKQYANSPIPRPPHWGGYRLIPNTFEFWQGGDNRLHDRFVFHNLSDDHWTRQRLAP